MPPDQRSGPPRPEERRFAGTYQQPDSRIPYRISATENGLAFGMSRRPLLPLADGSYTLADVPGFRVLFRESGESTHMFLLNGGARERGAVVGEGHRGGAGVVTGLARRLVSRGNVEIDGLIFDVALDVLVVGAIDGPLPRVPSSPSSSGRTRGRGIDIRLGHRGRYSCPGEVE